MRVVFQGYFESLFTLIESKIDLQIDEKSLRVKNGSQIKIPANAEKTANHLFYINPLPDNYQNLST